MPKKHRLLSYEACQQGPVTRLVDYYSPFSPMLSLALMGLVRFQKLVFSYYCANAEDGLLFSHVCSRVTRGCSFINRTLWTLLTPSARLPFMFALLGHLTGNAFCFSLISICDVHRFFVAANLCHTQSPLDFNTNIIYILNSYAVIIFEASKINYWTNSYNTQ